MTHRLFTACLLLTAAACQEHHDARGDAGGRRMRDASQDEQPQDPDSGVPTNAFDASDPWMPDDADRPDLSDLPMQPIVDLPAPSAGACAFEPRPDPSKNPKCPDGIVHASVLLTKTSEIAALLGCGRVAGNVTVRLAEPSNLDGLQALHVIDGNLIVEGKYFDEGGFHGGNGELTSLTGLENLRCVGGDLRIEQIELKYSRTLDLSALRDFRASPRSTRFPSSTAAA